VRDLLVEVTGLHELLIAEIGTSRAWPFVFAKGTGHMRYWTWLATGRRVPMSVGQFGTYLTPLRLAKPSTSS
jgi:hypothetical protein